MTKPVEDTKELIAAARLAAKGIVAQNARLNELEALLKGLVSDLDTLRKALGPSLYFYTHVLGEGNKTITFKSFLDGRIDLINTRLTP